MGRKLRVAALAAGMLFAWNASSAFADLEFLGAADGGSWYLNYAIDTAAYGFDFDEIQLTIDNGATMTFTNPTPDVTIGTAGSEATFSEFTDATDAFDRSAGSEFDSTSTWTESAGGTSTFAIATTGTDTNFLGFWIHLGTDAPDQTQADGTRFFIDVLRDGSVVARGQAYYKVVGSTTNEFRQLDIVAVPVPMAVWPGLAMLGGLAVIKRRRNSRVLS